jgi:hypothetical protein
MAAEADPTVAAVVSMVVEVAAITAAARFAAVAEGIAAVHPRAAPTVVVTDIHTVADGRCQVMAEPMAVRADRKATLGAQLDSAARKVTRGVLAASAGRMQAAARLRHRRERGLTPTRMATGTPSAIVRAGHRNLSRRETLADRLQQDSAAAQGRAPDLFILSEVREEPAQRRRGILTRSRAA